MALGAFCVVMFVGTSGYKYFGGGETSWMDAFYMTFLMVATIGYGGGVEVWHHPDTELFTILLTFAGIAIITFLFSSVTALVFASDFDESLRRKRMDKAMKKLSGHYILCGFGRVGRNVGHELDITDRDYVAIDEKLDELESYAEKHPGLLYIAGDAIDDDILLEANIAQAKGVFALTGDDSRNLMIAITAKQLAPHVRVVVRCSEVRNAEKMKKAGADAIVSPNFSGGMRIASAMIRPHVVTFLDEMLRHEHRLRVEEVVVPAEFEPRPFGNLDFKGQGYVLLAVRTHEDWTFNPPPDFLVEPGHTLIAMASPEGRFEMESRLYLMG